MDNKTIKYFVISTLLVVGLLVAFKSFASNGNPIKPTNAILIGDSQTEDIANNTQDAYMVDDLQKVGWWVINLLNALKKHPIDPTVSHVFVCIGTNGVFSKYDKVEELVAQLKKTFPNAILYVIRGSYGWESDNTGIDNIENIMDVYYKRFSNLGVNVLSNEIGYSAKHPSSNSQGIVNVANEIDSITALNK